MQTGHCNALHGHETHAFCISCHASVHTDDGFDRIMIRPYGHHFHEHTEHPVCLARIHGSGICVRACKMTLLAAVAGASAGSAALALAAPRLHVPGAFDVRFT